MGERERERERSRVLVHKEADPPWLMMLENWRGSENEAVNCVVQLKIQTSELINCWMCECMRHSYANSPWCNRYNAVGHLECQHYSTVERQMFKNQAGKHFKNLFMDIKLSRPSVPLPKKVRIWLELELHWPAELFPFLSHVRETHHSYILMYLKDTKFNSKYPYLV